MALANVIAPPQGVCFQKGKKYNIGGNIVCHTTGSGNYIDFTVPCDYEESITSASISFPSNSGWIAVLATGSQIYRSTIDLTNSATIWKTSWGITFEFKLNETKLGNTIGWIQGDVGFDVTFN